MAEAHDMLGYVFALSVLIIFGAIAYYVIMKLSSTPTVIDLRHFEHEINIETVRINSSQLVMHGREYLIAGIGGTIKQELLSVFLWYVSTGLNKRVPAKVQGSGRFLTCIEWGPEDKNVAFRRVVTFLNIYVFAIGLVFYLFGKEIIKVEADDRTLISSSLIAVGFGFAVWLVAFFLQASKRLFFPRWTCTGGGVALKGVKDEITIRLSEIATLEFTLVKYAIQFNVWQKDGSKLSINSKKLSKLLPLYNAIVHHRADLRIQQQGAGGGQAGVFEQRHERRTGVGDN